MGNFLPPLFVWIGMLRVILLSFQVAEAQRAEFSPAQFSGPKKISLNHLLNFTFEPRGHTNHFDGNGRGTWGKRNRWENKPFNKELFLQAKWVYDFSVDGSHHDKYI